MKVQMLFGTEFVDGAGAVRVAGLEDGIGELIVIHRIRMMLGFEAHRTAMGISFAAFAGLAF